MVVGIPNVGKSTFINAFAGKACAKTGNKPGVTKGKQWIRLNKNVELLDTPGILWPRFENQEVGQRLAMIGSMNDEVLNLDELALDTIKFLLKEYPGSTGRIRSGHHMEKEQKITKAELARRKREEKLAAERERIEALCEFEKEYDYCRYICGIDEAGRGPLAGPVVAGAVILPKGSRILYINDSKKLSEKKREELFDVISREAVSVGIGIVSAQRIDEINILQATYEAMRQAIQKLSVQPDILLNDAVTIPGVEIAQVPIIKGDAKSLTIGAASIMAKVTRDRMMAEYDKEYPQYGFAKHKGYGTKQHTQALLEYGACPIHRKTFLKNILNTERV